MSSSYKYWININQQAALELGLNVDIIDLAIFDFIKDFANSKKCVRTQTDEGVFFWVSHKTIIEQLPLLSITTPRGIAKRVENLINAGLLKKYSKCDELNRTLYTFGEKYDEYHFVHTPEQKFQGGGTKVQGIIDITDNSNNSPITDSTTMNSSPINSPIITETPLSPKRKSEVFDLTFIAPEFVDVMTQWLQYKKERKEPYKSASTIRVMYNNLISWSGNNVDVARKIVEFSIGNNYKGIIDPNKGNYGRQTSRPTDSQLLGAAIRNSWGPDGNPFD